MSVHSPGSTASGAVDPRDRAHAFAAQEGIADPDAFADEYAAFLEDRVNETRFPDLPDPEPSDYVR